MSRKLQSYGRLGGAVYIQLSCPTGQVVGMKVRMGMGKGGRWK